VERSTTLHVNGVTLEVDRAEDPDRRRPVARLRGECVTRKRFAIYTVALALHVHGEVREACEARHDRGVERYVTRGHCRRVR
jgi:hypothetical protein